VRRYQLRSLDSYVDEPFRGVDWQIQGMSATGASTYGTDAEWQAVLARVRAVPAYLATAEQQLSAGVAAHETPDWRVLEDYGLQSSAADADYFAKTLQQIAASDISSPQRETLLHELSALEPARPVFVEGESKKIGQLQVPDALLETMRVGRCVRVEAPIAARVKFLVAEYEHFLADPTRLKAQLDCLVGLHGRNVIAGWQAHVDRGDWEALVEDLLVSHYDPAYRRSTHKNYAALAAGEVLRPRDLSADSIARLARELRALADREPAAAPA